jgi:hypothetical protein
MLLPGRDVEGSHSRPDSSGNNVLVSRQPSHLRPLHPPSHSMLMIWVDGQIISGLNAALETTLKAG